MRLRHGALQAESIACILDGLICVCFCFCLSHKYPLTNHFNCIKLIRLYFFLSIALHMESRADEQQQHNDLRPPTLARTDTENIRFVFAAVKDTILQSNLKEYNLV